MTQRSIYIAGPMTGYPNRNFEAFKAAGEIIKARGNTVVNPAELEEAEADPDLTWAYYLRRDLSAMLDSCDGIALLPNWQFSRGAKLEYMVAGELGFRVELVSQVEIDDYYQNDNFGWAKYL